MPVNPQAGHLIENEESLIGYEKPIEGTTCVHLVRASVGRKMMRKYHRVRTNQSVAVRTELIVLVIHPVMDVTN